MNVNDKQKRKEQLFREMLKELLSSDKQGVESRERYKDSQHKH
ncbi:hypothetical protein [Cytobacillus firmus]|nr:hypothetical protein [Cytobacillus firmus]MED1904856.1 hypothetical protein [Cytobacillus firmus]MED1938908.1 hypothetical protein [Cytobacillus firmus]